MTEDSQHPSVQYAALREARIDTLAALCGDIGEAIANGVNVTGPTLFFDHWWSIVEQSP